MAYKRDEVYGLSPMDRLALETSGPNLPNQSQKYRDSIISDDLVVESRPRRKKRSPHCWLFTALFLFVIIMGALLLIHFHDEITGHAGVPVKLRPATNSTQQTYYLNAESGMMKNRTISGVEADILNALASGNTDKIEQYLKSIGIEPISTSNRGSYRKHALSNVVKNSSGRGGPLLANVSDDGEVDPLELILKYMPAVVQFLGGPSGGIVVAFLWLINTVEIRPLLIKYLGQDFVDSLVLELEGQTLPNVSFPPAPKTSSQAAPTKAAHDFLGFQQVGAPELIFPVDGYLINPETAAELQGLLYS